MQSGSRDHTDPRQRGHLLLRLLPRPDGGAVRVGAVPRLRDDPQLLAPLRDLPHQVPELLGQHQHTPGREEGNCRVDNLFRSEQFFMEQARDTVLFGYTLSYIWHLIAGDDIRQKLEFHHTHLELGALG